MANPAAGTVCLSCKQAITTAWVTAKEFYFHPGHFRCAFCDNSLEGKSFWDARRDDPKSAPLFYCNTCWEDPSKRANAPPAASPAKNAAPAPRTIPPKPVLHYFDIRGKGEQIRVILAYLGIDYVDKRITREAWATEKANYPFGQIPFYEDDKVAIPQSQAIVRYLARRHGLYGRKKEEEVQVDVALEIARDLRKDVMQTLLNVSDFANAKKEFTTAKLPGHLEKLEKLLANSDYLVGNGVTVADLVVFDLLDNFVKNIVPNYDTNFPKTAALHNRLRKHPKIDAYIQSGRRPITSVPNLPHFAALKTPEECK